MWDKMASDLLINGIIDGIKKGRILVKESISFQSAYNAAFDDYCAEYGEDEIYQAMANQLNTVKRDFFSGEIYSDTISEFAQHIATNSEVDSSDQRIKKLISSILENLATMKEFRERILRYKHHMTSENTYKYTVQIYNMLQKDKNEEQPSAQLPKTMENNETLKRANSDSGIQNKPNPVIDEETKSIKKGNVAPLKKDHFEFPAFNIKKVAIGVLILLLLAMSNSIYADRGDSFTQWLRNWMDYSSASKVGKSLFPFVLTLPFACATYMILYLFYKSKRPILLFLQVVIAILLVLFSFFMMTAEIFNMKYLTISNELLYFSLAYFSFVLCALIVGLILMLNGFHKIAIKYGKKITILQLLVSMALAYLSFNITFYTRRWSYIGIWKHTYWFWEDYAIAAIYLVNVVLLAVEVYILANAVVKLFPRFKPFQAPFFVGFAGFGDTPHNTIDRVCGSQSFICGVISFIISGAWIMFGIEYSNRAYHPMGLEILFRLLPMVAFPLGVIAVVQAWKYKKWTTSHRVKIWAIAGTLLGLLGFGFGAVYLVIGS